MRAAVVTGGGGGLGQAIVERLCADGWGVGIVDRDEDESSSLAQRLGPTTVPLVADVADERSLEAAIAEAQTKLGRISVLVNNAAIYPSTPFSEISSEEYHRVIAVNQWAYFRAAQLCSADMVEAGEGAIVNVSSITFHGGWPDLASYVSTKGAAVGLTRALARELGPAGIRVNGVSPGAFPTKAESIHPNPEEYERFVLDHQSLKRRGTPEELAAVVSFLVGPDASFVTGQTIEVNGGWVMS